MTPTESGTYTRIERRAFGGREARVRLAPDEIHVAWPTGRPSYYGVRTGDCVKDADRDVASPRIAEWEVTEITPDSVVGEDVDTGERREWDREVLERGLVVGNYATNLSGFETVVVHPVGSWETHDDHGFEYHGVPYLTVVAYGNNGESYGLRYRFREEGNERDVELRERDGSVERLDQDHRTLLESTVREALEADGYVVHERDGDA